MPVDARCDFFYPYLNKPYVTIKPRSYYIVKVTFKDNNLRSYDDLPTYGKKAFSGGLVIF